MQAAHPTQPGEPEADTATHFSFLPSLRHGSVARSHTCLRLSRTGRYPRRPVTVAWGILSTARINELVLAGARRSDRVQIVAVGSRDRVRAEAYAREQGLERAYGSYEELLEDPDVQAVYVSLPNSFHVEWSIRALEAGKHVLCEKPFTRNPEEAEQAFAVAERQERLLMEAFMWRHNPQVSRLQELIADRGSLFLSDPWHGWVAPRIEVRTDSGTEEIRLEPTDPYQLELENLSDAILGEAEPLIGRAETIAQARVLEALHASAQQGGPVKLR